ncbi:hypothetical protein FACS189425_01910 [Clostridia bacterium]|nr:hypothetical protein FACS189425_01910 [Clostridia bacterium]
MVDNYSDDPGSKAEPTGYIMGRNANMVQPFLAESWKLGVNESSDVVETFYGYHIIKRYPILTSEFAERRGGILSEMFQDDIANKALELKL